jgi:hypothetical protein
VSLAHDLATLIFGHSGILLGGDGERAARD